jgi:hypothetical protein
MLSRLASSLIVLGKSFSFGAPLALLARHYSSSGLKIPVGVCQIIRDFYPDDIAIGDISRVK